MTGLQSWFDKGMTKEEYIESMTVNKETLLSIYQHISLSEEDKEWLQAIKEKEWQAIVLTADWCGDAMVNLPIFMKLAEAADIQARFLIRDDNLELMDQYLTNGTARSIPIIIFIDQEGNEVTKWGPRAPQVQAMTDELRSSLPARDDAGYEDAHKAFISTLHSRYAEDMDLWQHIKTDIIQTLQQA